MTSRVELFPFQLETVRRVTQDLGGSAIIADEVGLGKTVEAGELIARLVADDPSVNILVCVPKALLYQWRAELLFKFDLLFEIEEEHAGALIVDGARGLKLLASHSKLSTLSPDRPLRSS